MNGLYRHSRTAFIASVSSEGSPETTLTGETVPNFEMTTRRTTVDALRGSSVFGYCGLTMVRQWPAIVSAGTLNFPRDAPVPDCIALAGEDKAMNTVVVTSSLNVMMVVPLEQKYARCALNISAPSRSQLRLSRLRSTSCSSQHSSSN